MHTDHGDVPIEQIKVGDEVIARDQRTGKSELKPVTDLIPKHQGTLVELRIEGEPRVLRPSVAHPFWTRFNDSDSGHWITAANLRPGELVETIDGNWRKIESVTHDSGEEPVYNFTVAKDHDYFVGETGFLVHNAGNCPCSWGNPNTLEDHFLRHGPDFGSTSPEDYANQAAQFFQDSQANGLPTLIGPGGVIRVFDPASNTFGSFNPNGTTKTFFKPTSPNYWGNQPGGPPCIP